MTSPDGAIVFRIFVTTEPGSNYARIAYQIDRNGKPVIETSYMGLEILRQEPYLGENTGLMDSKVAQTPRYGSLITRYMQNGSLGRRLDVETRVFDGGVAFRYVIARTAPVEEILVRDEVTEFNFPSDLVEVGAGLWRIPSSSAFVAVLNGPAAGGFPEMHLERSAGSATGFITRLMEHKNDTDYAYVGTTPMAGPWRVIEIGASEAAVKQGSVLKELER